jgi:hypothetical protein
MLLAGRITQGLGPMEPTLEICAFIGIQTHVIGLAQLQPLIVMVIMFINFQGRQAALIDTV